jgi:dihydrofolate reductase/uncharacterized protein YhbP (UPF0306 family)
VGRVLWHITMSLDGYIAGVDDAMDWVFGWPGPNAVADEIVATTGAIVVGRRTYEVEDRERGGFYGGAWKGPFFVLTHRPPATVPEWMTGTFLDAGIADAVAQARAAAGDRNVVVFGAGVARQAIERGLLDEIVVHLAPVLLGDGVRLFDVAGGARVDLEPTAVTTSGQITNLRFRVARPEPAAAGRAIVDAARYMTLGTADESGRPWVSPVWYAHQDHREFFWVSDPNARHSRNVAARPEVSLVVFDTTAAIGTGRGVYVTAVAEQLSGDELERGIAVFSRRSLTQGAAAWTSDDVLPPARLRLYRATASEAYLGEHDVRTQVEL